MGRGSWKFVVAGCGRMGLAHARRLANDPRARLVGFLDEDRGVAEQLRQQSAPETLVFESLEAALASGADAVVIATPTTCHHDQIVSVLDAGMHVLAEKPLAGDRAAISRLISLAESYPEQHCVLGYQRRFWATFRFLREQIASGSRGPILAVSYLTGEPWERGIAGTWRDDPAANSGGFLADAGSHKIDALMYVTGLQPRQLSAVTHFGRSRVPVVTSVTGWLDDQIPLTMGFTGNARVYYEELQVHCESADLILRDGMIWIAEGDRLSPVDLPADESGPQSTVNPVTGLLDLLDGQNSNVAPFSCALPVFDVTEAILESSRTGCSVGVDG